MHSTHQHALILISDVDHHLAQTQACQVAAPSERGQLSKHLDELLDYRLVLMAARDHLAPLPVFAGHLAELGTNTGPAAAGNGARTPSGFRFQVSGFQS